MLKVEKTLRTKTVIAVEFLVISGMIGMSG